MRETWRWYGELDKISLSEIAQTGAKGIVTALHEIPYGELWNTEQVLEVRDKILSAGLGLNWDVVESLPIHEDIKMGTGDLKTLFGNYRKSLENLANAGLKTICYNFENTLSFRNYANECVPKVENFKKLKYLIDNDNYTNKQSRYVKKLKNRFYFSKKK